MELRVWVDGAQRVVCGVKLTTTCQEIVFALAHATQQAGRFTMIERWRNNERLLSPNEQPLVTLQRWGDRMNEVEFILRKTSTDPVSMSQQQPNTNNLPPQQQQQQVVNNNMPSKQHSASNQQHQNVTTRTTTPAGSITSKQTSQKIDNDHNTRQQAITNGGSSHESPVLNHIPPLSHQTQPQQLLADQAHDNLYQQQRHFNLSRRPQTSLGPLTSSNSALNIESNHYPLPLNRVENFRSSLSSSALPNPSNGGAATQSNSVSMARSCYNDDKPISPSLYNTNNNSHNGYHLQNETSRYQQTVTNHTTKNYPYEDLYSTINKKRTSQPPAVPAKPRLVSNLSHPQQSMNNAQMNYYHPDQSPVHMFSSNLRPRHPPGYMEYLEAMANRNSLPASLVSNPSYILQSQSVQGNMFPRSSYDLQNHQFYNLQRQHQNGSSPANSSNGNQYYYLSNQQANRANFALCNELNQQTTSMRSKLNQINPKLIDSGLVINRGSAVNIKLPPNSHFSNHNQSSIEEQRLDTSMQSNSSSVSQMGLDMLKVIEEQKKLLLNQKNELERLDHDQEYFEAKQNSEQAELINRIEKEIAQLETLWRENQVQIKKLENQDFERELELLKAEQVRMENEIDGQKGKLARFENDIAQCRSKIEQLESELDNLGLENDGNFSDEDNQDSGHEKSSSKDDVSKEETNQELRFQKLNLGSNGSGVVSSILRDSKDEDEEDDSGGDASDDLNTVNNPGSKLRSAKDVASVDKRGLINGIRSLKLDKTRALNRSNEKINNAENVNNRHGSNILFSNHLMHKDQTQDASQNGTNSIAPVTGTSHSETNGQNDISTTASNNNNKYEFLMTL